MKTWGTHWEQVDMVRAREKIFFLKKIHQKHLNYGKSYLQCLHVWKLVRWNSPLE